MKVVIIFISTFAEMVKRKSRHILRLTLFRAALGFDLNEDLLKNLADGE